MDTAYNFLVAILHILVGVPSYFVGWIVGAIRDSFEGGYRNGYMFIPRRGKHDPGR